MTKLIKMYRYYVKKEMILPSGMLWTNMAIVVKNPTSEYEENATAKPKEKIISLIQITRSPSTRVPVDSQLLNLVV